MSVDSSVIYEFAGRRVDPLRRQLMHGGRIVTMFPRCFDALLLLIERRGELLDKDFLLQALWPDVVVDENSLAKVISEVRRALGEGPRDQGCIVTIPRRGYRFNANVEVSRAVGSSNVPPPGRGEIRSLAVLPFTFLNPVATDESLGIGLADALITRLGQLRRTLVRPTSSIARFAAQPMAPAAAGRALEVDAVITGTIRRSGTQMRVGVQLVSVREDAVTWAERFDADSMGALELEDSIAERVATALTLALAREEKPPEPRRYTANADAYEHYIRGRYLATKRTRDAMLEAVRCFERAIAIDPVFALAYAGLGATCVHMGIRAAVSQSFRPREVMPKGRAAAEKALALDDMLSEAHAAFGHVMFIYEWQRDVGIASLQRAIQINPNNQNAHQWYAMALAGVGRIDDALAQIQRAREIDPLVRHRERECRFPVVSRAAFRRSRRQPAAHRRDGADVRHVALSSWPRARITRTLRRSHRGVRSHASGCRESAGPDGDRTHARAHGPVGRGAAPARRTLPHRPTAYVPAAQIADVHAALGDRERTLDFLEQCVEERSLVGGAVPLGTALGSRARRSAFRGAAATRRPLGKRPIQD